MIILNGQAFAKNNNEFIDSLFTTGGTCTGYYRVNKRTITIMDQQKTKIAVISNNVLGKATKLDNGKWWYSYSDIDLIGKYNSYMMQCNEIEAITNRYNLPVKY